VFTTYPPGGGGGSNYEGGPTRSRGGERRCLEGRRGAGARLVLRRGRERGEVRRRGGGAGLREVRGKPSCRSDGAQSSDRRNHQDRRVHRAAVLRVVDAEDGTQHQGQEEEEVTAG